MTLRRGAWALLLLGLIPAQSLRAEPLVVGANIGNVPWEFQARDGQYVGFEIDLARALAEALGQELELRNIPFNGLRGAVRAHRCGGVVHFRDAPALGSGGLYPALLRRRSVAHGT